MRVVAMFAAIVAATAVSSSAAAGAFAFEGTFNPGSPATFELGFPPFAYGYGSFQFEGAALVSLDYSISTDLDVNRTEHIHVASHCSAAVGEYCVLPATNDAFADLKPVFASSTQRVDFILPSNEEMEAFTPDLPPGSYFHTQQFGGRFSIFTFNFGPDAGPVHYRASVYGLPEPTAWSLMLAGFGLSGAALRRRRRAAA